MRKGKNGGKQLILLVELGGLELQPSGHCQEMGEARRSHSASFAPNEKDARRNICRGNCRARHSRKPAHRTTASRHRKAQQLQGNTNHAAAAKPYGLRRCDPYQPAVTLEPEGQGFRISRSALTLRAEVPNLDEAAFARIAGDAEKNCPVSKVLNASITLDAELV